jgi:hypothetical protein
MAKIININNVEESAIMWRKHGSYKAALKSEISAKQWRNQTMKASGNGAQRKL